MRIISKDGEVKLAEYHGEDDSCLRFAKWFESTFDCYLDYTNEEAFIDDFFWGIVTNKEFHGIAHFGFLPAFFKDGFYLKACENIPEYPQRTEPTLIVFSFQENS